MLCKADGRCQVRSVLYAAATPLPDGVHDILNGDDVATRAFIRRIRSAAAQRVLETSRNDDTLAMLLDCSFPDEHFETFGEWAAAMATDDTHEPISQLWNGGGQWLLYGMGLLLGLTIVVTSYYPSYSETSGCTFVPGVPQEVVTVPPGKRVHLAMLHDDDGIPDHFDALEAPLTTPPGKLPSIPPSPPVSEVLETIEKKFCMCRERGGTGGGYCRSSICWRHGCP